MEHSDLYVDDDTFFANNYAEHGGEDDMFVFND